MTSLHRDPRLRASDSEREHVAELLREHCATGRLTMDEFGDRLERCYVAQTYGDLDALVADLPEHDPYHGLPVPVDGHRSPGGGSSNLLARFEGVGHDQPWAAWLTASVICWAIWLAVLVTGGGLAGVWPVWVSLPWGAVLVAGTLTGHDHPRSLPPGDGSSE